MKYTQVVVARQWKVEDPGNLVFISRGGQTPTGWSWWLFLTGGSRHGPHAALELASKRPASPALATEFAVVGRKYWQQFCHALHAYAAAYARYQLVLVGDGTFRYLMVSQVVKAFGLKEIP